MCKIAGGAVLERASASVSLASRAGAQLGASFSVLRLILRSPDRLQQVFTKSGVEFLILAAQALFEPYKCNLAQPDQHAKKGSELEHSLAITEAQLQKHFSLRQVPTGENKSRSDRYLPTTSNER